MKKTYKENGVTVYIRKQSTLNKEFEAIRRNKNDRILKTKDEEEYFGAWADGKSRFTDILLDRQGNTKMAFVSDEHANLISRYEIY